jgi:hypothetical protein
MEIYALSVHDYRDAARYLWQVLVAGHVAEGPARWLQAPRNRVQSHFHQAVVDADAAAPARGASKSQTADCALSKVQQKCLVPNCKQPHAC